ncbi:MAG: 3-oxoadipate enol-lactonase [Solirubrobacteraceae bacterium]
MSPVVLHDEETGPATAPVLLLGASLGATGAMWEPQVSALQRRLRLVRFEHRGHGSSPAPKGPYSIAGLGEDVLALMDRLDIERAAYCGLSLGGMVGQWLASAAPSRIDRLILICTSAHLPPAEGWRERAATVRAAGTPAVVADAVVARWFTASYAERNPRTVARHRQMIASVAPEGYAGCCEAIATMDLRAALTRITAPTLVIAGRQDPATPPQHAETITAAVDDARLVVLDPAAHLSSVERAGDVTRLIAEHLATPTGDDR